VVNFRVTRKFWRSVDRQIWESMPQ